MAKTTIITIPGEKLTTTLCEHKGFSKKDLDKIIDALCIISYLVNRSEFEQDVLKRKFTFTNDSSATVFKKMMN